LPSLRIAMVHGPALDGRKPGDPAGRPHPQGRAADRTVGHRKDAAGTRGRWRGRRAVFLDLGRPEEIVFDLGLIDEARLEAIIKRFGKSAYGQYLGSVLEAQTEANPALT
jgi:hypothetical protein